MKNHPGKEIVFDEDVHFSSYMDTLYRRKRVVGIVALLMISVVALYTFKTEPVYMASASLLIDRETAPSRITGERAEYESNYSQSLTFNTHFKLIKSKPNISEVIEKLGLGFGSEESGETVSKNTLSLFFQKTKEAVSRLFNKNEIALSPQDKQQKLIEKIIEKISIDQVHDTRLLKISVRDKDPSVAADIANALAEVYIESDLSSRMASSRKSLGWMNNELIRLKQKLEDDEQKFTRFKEENRIFSIQGKQKIIEQKIAEFNNRYLETRNQRLELDTRLAELERHIKHGRALTNVRSLIDNRLIDTIYSRILDLEIEQSKLSRTYGSKHPKIIQNQEELAKSRKRLALELNREKTSLESQRKILFTKEKALEKTIEGFEKDALDTSRKELKYAIYQRTLNTSQGLYNSLLERIKESTVLQTSDTSNIRLVERAVAAMSPVLPNKKRNLLVGLIAGILIGCAVAYGLDYMDQTVQTEDDIHHYLNLRVLSVVPESGDCDHLEGIEPLRENLRRFG